VRDGKVSACRCSPATAQRAQGSCRLGVTTRRSRSAPKGHVFWGEPERARSLRRPSSGRTSRSRCAPALSPCRYSSEAREHYAEGLAPGLPGPDARPSRVVDAVVRRPGQHFVAPRAADVFSCWSDFCSQRDRRRACRQRGAPDLAGSAGSAHECLHQDEADGFSRPGGRAKPMSGPSTWGDHRHPDACRGRMDVINAPWRNGTGLPAVLSDRAPAARHPRRTARAGRLPRSSEAPRRVLPGWGVAGAGESGGEFAGRPGRRRGAPCQRREAAQRSARGCRAAGRARRARTVPPHSEFERVAHRIPAGA